MEKIKRILAMVLVTAMMVTFAPMAFITEAYAAETDTRIADGTTLDGWETYFGKGNSFSTRYAGHVWTDKSVTTDAGKFAYATELANSSNKITINAEDRNNFLVALSAMASSESVKGEANKPTDTMIVLDLSSSMYNGSEKNTNAVNTMVNAVNDMIVELQALNVNNRVGVTIYFGGPDLLQAKGDCYQLWLPLDRYTQNNNKFLTIKTSGGNLTSVGVNSGVKNSKGSNVAAATRTVPNVSGTYTQMGILSALAEFTAADTYVPANAAVNAGQPRVPVMVLMTDGEPTAATNKFSQLGADAIMGSNRADSRSANETDFLTQLTAAYAKKMMDVRYKEEKPIFYTLGVKAEADSPMSYDVIDPSDTLGISSYNPSATISGYWNKLVAGGSLSITYKICKGQWDSALVSKTATVSRVLVDGKSFPASVSERQYVDKAFLAENISQMTDGFKNILADISIQTHTYPTLVEDDENLDGYVSFVDKIGKYMSVTDVKGIIMGTHWYSGKEMAKSLIDGSLGTVSSPTVRGDELVRSISKRLDIATTAGAALVGLAYERGQLSYSSDTEYSNYFGWYADENGNYIGFWDEGATTDPADAVYKNKSYLYLGETDAVHGIADSDMMYATVRVSKNIRTGEEQVVFGVPAALIPIVEYDVELNGNGEVETFTKGGATNPVRLVYEVALNDNIDEFTLYDSSVVDPEYVTENANSDGSVNFYTNQYEADGTVGYGKVNTYSYFRPSRHNESYYYQENSTIYSDTNGKVYSGSSIDVNGTFFRAVKYYEKSDSSVDIKTQYVQIPQESLEHAEKSGNSWYIPSGDVFVNVSGYLVEKGQNNKTNTLENANNPFVDIYDHSTNDANHRFVVGDTLGNNGKVTVYPKTGLRIAKNVVNNTAAVTDSFEFTIECANETNGSYSCVITDADGKATNGTITFESGKASISLKDGESVIITGLSGGNIYKITETEYAGFVIDSVTINGTSAANSAEVTLEENKIATAEFTNAPRAEGSITIAKLLEYPAGVSQDIEDEEFTLNVKMEGIAVNAGDKFSAKHTGEGDVEVTLGEDKSFNVVLKNGESIEISGVPEGTKVTVTEIGLENIFEAEYFVNNTSCGTAAEAVVEIAKAPTVSNVTVVNKYEPAPAEVKINLNGVKTLFDEDGNVIPKEDWEELQFKFIIQRYDAATGEWVNTEASDFANSENDAVDFLGEGRVLTFDKIGTYGYQVIEENHGLTINGITFDSTMHTFDVIVTDADLDGKLEAKVQSSHGDTNNFTFEDNTWINNNVNFTNINKQGETSVLIMIKKNLTNNSGSPLVSPEGFGFELYKTDSEFIPISGESPINLELSDAAGESYIFLEYEYTAAGTETYYYQLREVIPDDENKVPGMVYSGEYYNFIVEVVSDNEGEISATVTSAETEGDGNSKKFIKYVEKDEVTGIEIEYDLAMFNNRYDLYPAEATLNVSKKLERKNLAGDDFEFVLERVYPTANLRSSRAAAADPADSSQPKPTDATFSMTVKNDANGTVDFGNLVFDKVGTYYYTITETAKTEEGLVCDATIHEVVVTVTDGGEGSLVADVDILTVAGDEIVFTNKYTPKDAEIVIDGKKELTGKDLLSGHFIFILEECDENGVVKENGKKLLSSNVADGSFAFEKLTYSEAGTHYYLVYEDIPAEKLGITYDTTKYLVKTDVAYDMDRGEFAVTKTIIGGNFGNDIVFENEYKATPINAVIPGFKDLEGRNLENEQFEFTLYKSDASWQKGEKIQSVKNDENGNYWFELYEDDGYFKSAGTYYFLVDENDPDPIPAGYTYDEKTVRVTITVTDDLRGNFHYEIAYTDVVSSTDDSGSAVTTENDVAALIFNNVYEVTGTAEITIEGIKRTEGMTLLDKEFTFILNNERMEGLKATQNDKDGKFSFTMEYFPMDVGETYTYYVTEKNDYKYGIDYDETIFTVVVKVLDNGQGGIATEVTVDGNPYVPFGEKGQGGIVFVNKFVPREEPEKEPENEPKGDEEENVITGGDMNIALLAAVTSLSVIGMAGSMIAGKKKK